MKRKSLKNRILYVFQFVPFTWNTVFFGALFFASYKFLYIPITKENASDAQLPFIRLMASFVGWLILAIVLLSVLSTIATWLYFLWLRKQGKSKLELHFFSEEKGTRKKQFLEAALPKVIKPILGFVKGRLFYDNQQLTDRFTLLSSRRQKNNLLRDAITGKSRISLPDIKEYQIKGNIIFFEDMLQIISLPVSQQMGGNFYQSPKTLLEKVEDVAPKKTDTMDIRIDELRKVEGEFLNYKDFESGDDVRRIVWKVFAKNRELVVRIPERMEPYASHLYFYASFFSSINTNILGNDYFAEMLNFYKTNVWSVYEELQKKEWKIRYIPDQEFTINENANEQERDERIVSNSDWQSTFSTRSYFSPKKGTVLVISSLTDPKELAQILEESDTSVRIFYVQLSQIFHQYVALNWIKNLFFIPAPDRLSKLKNKWIFSPLRRQILKNEKQIEALLK
ncbi:MAG: DUF58 domain-containing protein [Chitinophagaceae bacterium]|jgi:hypothetical protein